MENQNEYTFNGQRPGEKVVLVLNRHPYTIYRPGFASVLLLIVALAVVLFFPKFFIISIVLFLLIFLYFYNAFYGYKESVFIITNERLFSVNQAGFFKRSISETNLDNVIDIRSETKGFFKTVLHYGSLIVRTAGANEEGDIIIEDIPDPYFAQQKIAQVRAKKTD
ncbi:MAG: hypothetical protein NTW50_02265 [Candidatus Berkelbacteria bacterium]|nr:hypothetical protein [Candidatus Berkelbacteria bacterium]